MSDEQRKQQIAKELSKKVSRPITAKEKRVQSAAVAHLAGDKIADIEKVYAVNLAEINRLLKKAFSSDEDRFKFLEECMMSNSVLAMGQFHKKYGEMTAIEAAKASTMFAGRALDIKKAREAGFKEAPINVGVIVALQKTLDGLQTKN